MKQEITVDKRATGIWLWNNNRWHRSWNWILFFRWILLWWIRFWGSAFRGSGLGGSTLGFSTGVGADIETTTGGGLGSIFFSIIVGFSSSGGFGLSTGLSLDGVSGLFSTISMLWIAFPPLQQSLSQIFSGLQHTTVSITLFFSSSKHLISYLCHPKTR